MEARPNPSEWIVVESGKLEAITDTIHNLKHFEEKTENNFLENLAYIILNLKHRPEKNGMHSSFKKERIKKQ